MEAHEAGADVCRIERGCGTMEEASVVPLCKQSEEVFIDVLTSWSEQHGNMKV